MKKDYLIQEKPLKALLIFAFPILAGSLFQQFYTMADSVVVGRFVGEQALAAIGASYSLTAVFIAVAIGGGAGASVITSQYFGAGEYGNVRQSVRTALLSFFILSLGLGIFGRIGSRIIMELLHTPQESMAMAVEYLNVYFLGLPFLFMYNILASMFQALGRSKIPLYLLVFSSVFNIGLDLFLVCIFHMGVTGAAWATLIAQGISAVLSWFLFLKELRSYPVKENGGWFERRMFGSMARVAFPSILQQSTISVGMLLVQSVVNGFGAEVLAGFSAGTRIENICIVPMSAIGSAISSYTAQNIGAGKIDRVQKGYHIAYGIVAGFAFVLCIWLETAYVPLIQMFLGTEGTAAAMQTGMSYLRFIGWFFGLIGLKMITDGVLRGAGDMKMFTVANLVNLGIRVAVAMLLAPRLGVEMVWIAIPIGWSANYMLSFLEYRTGRWKTGIKKDFKV